MKLKLSDSLSLPLDAVTQTFGFVGKRGSGNAGAIGGKPVHVVYLGSPF